MPSGDLHRYIAGEVEGLPYHYMLANVATLGGYGNPRSATAIIYTDQPLERSLLSLHLASEEIPRGNILWKVSLNNVTLTREFKPQITVLSDEGAFAVQVFDVSKLTGTSSRLELKVMTESSGLISIEAITLFGIIPRKGFKTGLEYYIGSLVLRPSDRYSLRLGSRSNSKGAMFMVMSVPSRNAVADVLVNDRVVYTVRGITGTYDFTVRDIELTPGGAVLAIRYREPKAQYFPKYIKVFNVAAYETMVRGPYITISKAVIDNERLHLAISNEGDIAAERVILIGLSAGEVVFRDVVDRVGPSELVERSYVLHEGKVRSGQLIVRAIYYGIGGQSVISRKVVKP
ncbi:MAG: hypothetical protein DRO09_00850 [Thermoprotei archaeon]|nr:MAG: hypothetical protein DRO09_00850 [Thermoprotei archaeon]